MLRVRRDTLVRALLAHGEDDLAERAPLFTDEELKRIGELAEHYAFSEEHALPSGGSMGTTRAMPLATVDVLEDSPRELHRKEGQRDRSVEEEARPGAVERDECLRSQAGVSFGAVQTLGLPEVSSIVVEAGGSDRARRRGSWRGGAA